jgi:uncharacterized damage-inducible protein DinB
MPISQMLLPEFDQEMANTRKTLQRVPDDKLDYKPHEKSMTLGRLAGHIAELPGWGSMTLNTDNFDLDPGAYKPLVPASRDEALAVFDKNAAEARAEIEKASDEALTATWTLSVNGHPVMSMPRVAVLRSVVVNHIIHHRAQLGVYLRMNDIEVPGVYGPSADEPNRFASSPKS